MENLTSTFTGVFIPADLLADKELTLQEKVVLAIINNLDNGIGCIAKNNYFATILNLSTRRIAGIIEKLEIKGYIIRKDIKTKRIINVKVKNQAENTANPGQEEIKESEPNAEVNKTEEVKACDNKLEIQPKLYIKPINLPNFDNIEDELPPSRPTLRTSFKRQEDTAESVKNIEEDIKNKEVSPMQRLLNAGFSMVQIEKFYKTKEQNVLTY